MQNRRISEGYTLVFCPCCWSLLIAFLIVEQSRLDASFLFARRLFPFGHLVVREDLLFRTDKICFAFFLLFYCNLIRLYLLVKAVDQRRCQRFDFTWLSDAFTSQIVIIVKELIHSVEQYLVVSNQLCNIICFSQLPVVEHVNVVISNED